MTHAILVVEDEAVIREDTCGHLEGYGFTVLQAESAWGAICKIMRHPAFALVFTDICMPGPMDGCDLALWIGWCHVNCHKLLKAAYWPGSQGPA